jgi:hypothetical protein
MREEMRDADMLLRELRILFKPWTDRVIDRYYHVIPIPLIAIFLGIAFNFPKVILCAGLYCAYHALVLFALLTPAALPFLSFGERTLNQAERGWMRPIFGTLVGIWYFSLLASWIPLNGNMLLTLSAMTAAGVLVAGSQFWKTNGQTGRRVVMGSATLILVNLIGTAFYPEIGESVTYRREQFSKEVGKDIREKGIWATAEDHLLPTLPTFSSSTSTPVESAPAPIPIRIISLGCGSGQFDGLQQPYDLGDSLVDLIVQGDGTCMTPTVNRPKARVRDMWGNWTTQWSDQFISMPLDSQIETIGYYERGGVARLIDGPTAKGIVTDRIIQRQYRALDSKPVRVRVRLR